MADPSWDDPLDGSYAGQHGGRWNPSDSFAVVYLNRDRATARANADRKLAGQPFTWDDMRPERRPLLIGTEVAPQRYVDIVTDRGCRAAGLPDTYPLGADGAMIGRSVCQPIGSAAHDQDEPGIACRSAATATVEGEELAWFQREAHLLPDGQPEPFEHWYWGR